MVKRVFFLSVSAFFVLISSVFCKTYLGRVKISSYFSKDPFQPKIPQSKKEEAFPQEPESLAQRPSLPEFKLEGVVWRGKFPQAIIDGEVYKLGDKIGTSSAKIVKIRRDGVELEFYGKLYFLPMGEKKVKGEKKSERQIIKRRLF